MAALGLKDAYYEDNNITAGIESISIPSRTINLEALGSGNGTIINLDPRGSYPDNFALPLLVQPDPGYVYSAGAATGDLITPSSLVTVVLDGSFDGKIFFEPSFETWAAEQIPAASDRGRANVVGQSTVPNIFKYLLGYDANSQGPSSPLNILEDTETNEKFVELRVVRGREGEPLTIRSSSNLNQWEAMQPEITNDGEWLLFESPVPEHLEERAFFKLQTP
jgi:hypothetical protein